MYQPSARRIPELNGFRVLMVFVVSWFHIWQQSWLTPYVGGVSLDFLVRAGYVPVDGTILLSGFLLFLPYARHMLLGERMPEARAFYRRRVMRVVPSYTFVTLLTLFAVALPNHLYASPRAMWTDLAAHLTWTFTFFRGTYMGTQLGGASWTLVIEAQMYLLFPLLAARAVRRPGRVTLALLAVAWGFRAYCVLTMREYGMVLNQLPNMLDLYAMGMAAAVIYVRLTTLWPKTRARQIAWETAATALLAVAVALLVRALRAQASTQGIDVLQRMQMLRRPLFGGLMALMLLTLPFALRPVRLLFGNRLMDALAAISMNYYLTHQTVAVQLKRLGIPASAYEAPHQAGDRPWQYAYTGLCFGLSLLLAALITFLVEKPCAALLARAFRRLDARKSASR